MGASQLEKVAHRLTARGDEAACDQHQALLDVQPVGVFPHEAEQEHAGHRQADVAVQSGDKDVGAEDDFPPDDGELLVLQMVPVVGQAHHHRQEGDDQKQQAPFGQAVIALDKDDGDHEIEAGDRDADISQSIQSLENVRPVPGRDPHAQHA